MTPTLLSQYIIYTGLSIWWLCLVFYVTLYFMGALDKEDRE